MKCENGLYTMYGRKDVPFPEDVRAELNKCLICKKQIMVCCGTPIVRYGGCCVGVRKGKQEYINSRSCHMDCWRRWYPDGKLFKLMTRIK